MSNSRKIIQGVLLVFIIVAGVRLYLTLRERQSALVAPKKIEVPLDPDYYVFPKKLHPQNLKDAKELTRQPVWVREGYRYTYYPFPGRADFDHPAGTLGPIQKLNIKDVVLQTGPKGMDERQVMATFEENGRRYAVPIGAEDHGTYEIYSDEIFFIQDPHELYKYWPADVWTAIENHQMKLGMNELQASFAIGMGTPEGSGTENPRVVDYPNGGHPLRVSYSKGRAVEVDAR